MNKFLAGAAFHSAIMSLFQDCIGKEGYIDIVNRHWIDPRISVPIALLIVVLSMMMFFEKKDEGKANKEGD